jgi:transposase-like protein
MNTNERRTNGRGHTKWSKDDRNQLLEEYSKSGQTKKAFCAEHGIHITTFYGWAKRAKQKRKKAKASSLKFKEVSVPVNSGHAVEIILPGGARVCLAGNGNQEDLAKLIRSIAAC